MSSTRAESQSVKAGDIPTTTFGKTGIQVSIIAQGGARMDLHPDIPAAAAHVRRVYELGVTYFDCARVLGRALRRSVRHRPAGHPEKRLSHDQDPKAHGEGSGAGLSDLPAPPED